MAWHSISYAYITRNIVGDFGKLNNSDIKKQETISFLYGDGRMGKTVLQVRCASVSGQVQHENKFLFCSHKFLLKYVQLVMLQNGEAEQNY